MRFWRWDFQSDSSFAWNAREIKKLRRSEITVSDEKARNKFLNRSLSLTLQRMALNSFSLKIVSVVALMSTLHRIFELINYQNALLFVLWVHICLFLKTRSRWWIRIWAFWSIALIQSCIEKQQSTFSKPLSWIRLVAVCSKIFG